MKDQCVQVLILFLDLFDLLLPLFDLILSLLDPSLFDFLLKLYALDFGFHFGKLFLKSFYVDSIVLYKIFKISTISV
jgi:hypothetical protein